MSYTGSGKGRRIVVYEDAFGRLNAEPEQQIPAHTSGPGQPYFSLSDYLYSARRSGAQIVLQNGDETRNGRYPVGHHNRIKLMAELGTF